VRDGLSGGESVIVGDPPEREGAALVVKPAAAGETAAH
jgi:hypothetical protein